MVQKGRLLLIEDCNDQEIFERLVSHGYGVERTPAYASPRLRNRQVDVVVASSNCRKFLEKYSHELRNNNTPFLVYYQSWETLGWQERETMKGMASYGHFDISFATVPKLCDELDSLYRRRHGGR